MHRNLKPDKIIMTDDHRVKTHGFELSDMGSTLTGADYMAPEIWSSDNDYTLSVDVYSFDLVLYKTLVGMPVFCPIPAITLMNSAAQGERAPIPDNVNQISRNSIKMCWQGKAEARPTFQAILDLAKQVNFCFLDGIDSRQVAEYVRSVEACATGLNLK
jgi:serine/threonine protein kinase